MATVTKDVVDSSAGGEKLPKQGSRMVDTNGTPRGRRSRIVMTAKTHPGYPVKVSAKTGKGETQDLAISVVKDDPPSFPLPAIEREDAEAYIAELAVAAEGDVEELPLGDMAYVIGVEKDGAQQVFGLVARADGAAPRLVEAYSPPISISHKASIFSASSEKISVIPTTKRVVSAVPELEWFPPILKDGEKRVATYVVLEPDEVDKQGDIYGADVIESAAHDFLANYNKNKTRPEDYEGTQTGVRHVILGVDADVVESYVAPCDLTFGEETVKKGSWVASLHYRDEDLWDRVKTGELPGISIGGAARAILLGTKQEKS